MLSLHAPIPSSNSFAPLNPRLSPIFSAPNTGNHLPSSSSHRLFSLTSGRRRAAVGVGEDGLAVAEGEVELPAGLRLELMPKHVAVIMDGNGRWAKQRGLLPGSGHEAGVRSLREMVELCSRWGIQVLTVFAFSADNWIRPKVEVDFLMRLFERALKREVDSFARAKMLIARIWIDEMMAPVLTSLCLVGGSCLPPSLARKSSHQEFSGAYFSVQSG